MSLKKEFVSFVKQELEIPLVGVAAPESFSREDVNRITPVLKLFSRSTPLAAGAETLLTAEDFLPEARSVIITGIPGYLGTLKSFESCREKLLGRAEPSHVNIALTNRNQEKSMQLCEFFTKRGFQCFSVVGMQFPLKLVASRCGVGFYGKNAVIQHPDYGSWIGLMGYVTDAKMEPDEPLTGNCGTCERCIEACPTGALYEPYRCDAEKCLDFNLGHNKLTIPHAIREKSENLLGEGCTACRDACPRNASLTPMHGYATPEELLYPALPDIFEMTDDEWDRGFAMTLMGFFLLNKSFLQRNAAIGLGNFQDERAVPVLERVLAGGDDEVRGYAAWALGRIGGEQAKRALKDALDGEKTEAVQREISEALSIL